MWTCQAKKIACDTKFVLFLNKLYTNLQKISIFFLCTFLIYKDFFNLIEITAMAKGGAENWESFSTEQVLGRTDAHWGEGSKGRPSVCEASSETGKGAVTLVDFGAMTGTGLTLDLSNSAIGLRKHGFDRLLLFDGRKGNSGLGWTRSQFELNAFSAIDPL